MSHPNHAELVAAASYGRNLQFAQMVTMVVGLAAETHPEELRAALTKVFDLTAVEDMTRRITDQVLQAQREATAARDTIRQLRQDLEWLEERYESLTMENL